MEQFFLFTIYLIPVLAWVFSKAFRKSPKFVPIVFFILVFLLLLIILNNRVLFVTARPIVPTIYCLAYLAIWSCSLAIRKKVLKILFTSILSSVHALLMLGFVILIWIIGDGLAKPVSQYEVGPISVYTREWGTFSRSGNELVIAKKIAGAKGVEALMYREKCGYSGSSCVSKYDIKRQGQSYQIRIILKNGETEIIE